MDSRQLALLRIHDVCRGLSDEDIEAVGEQCEAVQMKAGEILHAVGQKLDALYLVAQGRLRMSTRLPGGKMQTLRYISAGDQFGAMMLVTEDDYPVEVEVDESAILFKLVKASVIEIAEKFPVLRRNVMRKIGIGLQDSMVKKRKRSFSKIVAFIHADDQSRKIVSKVATQLAQAGEKIGVFCDSAKPPYDSDIPYVSLRHENGEYVDESDVRKSVAAMSDLKRIFLVVDRVHPYEKLLRLVALSNSLFFLSNTDESTETINELKGILDRSPSWKKKTHFVWVLKEQEQVAPLTPELEKLVERDFKVQLPDNDSVTRMHSQGIDRIVHYLRGVSIGIALSGGAARGMTHLGVLKALEESEITIDKLCGTSAGVLTGVLYCAGFSTDWAINQFTKDLEPGSIFKRLPKGDGFYMLHKYRSKSWDKMLRKYLGDWCLEQCPIPVSTVTADLVSAKSVVRSTGDAVHSILESINLPGLSVPICRDGMLLVDGGILNNLPADIMASQGCNAIIGVDVSAHIEHHVGQNTSTTPTEKMKAPGVVTTLLRCLNVQANNLSGLGAQSADVIIAPDVSGFDSAAFTETPAMSEIGYEATMEAMPQIREYLHNLDSDLFA